MNIRNYIYLTNILIMHSRKMRLLCMILLCLLTHNTLAQDATKPVIVIGGDVYGGGLEGKVGVAPAEGQEITAEQANTEVTNVTIAGGQLRTVFGGGKNGEVFGKTTVSIKGGEIGADKWEGTPYGGVYGGGEGDSAIVHGHTDVTIGGGTNYNNVYGGGKQALLKGNSNVTLESGIIRNRVFAGARMADINGYGLVNIVGDNSEDADMLIVRAVYGGNDISGSIFNRSKNKPTDLTMKVAQGLPEGLASFVFSQNTATNVFIGNVFGGGNGDYKYENDTDNEGKLQINLVKEQLPNDEDEIIVTFKNLNKPEADYAYLQIEGGTFGNIYGGGNNATILKQTDIYYGIDDAVIKPLKGIPSENLSWLKLYEGFTKDNENNTFDLTYNAFRIFGGNNLAEMNIRPKWHLKSGTVGNIYSGGNKGKMTNPNGIILTITSPDLKAHNVYGGCRMADVEPKGVETIAEETYAYHSYNGENFVEKYDAQYDFKEGYAARVLVTDGKINNLYGGNDISGKVHFGTNVELRGAISGDVYGGGNGSYAYTDNAEWIKSHPEDADYFYESGSTKSIDAMYAYRPHVEKTLLHITGIGSTAPPVYVTGGVYCGGNSATLAKDGNRDDATATFEIGKHVVINSVFLGSNGKNMVADDILQKYANNDFSSITLTDNAQFAKYMEAVAVNLKPTITWEWDDDAVPGMNDAGKGITNATEAYIGAFYCGGNVGSMTTPKQMAMDFPKGLTIFNRIVGGCNSARIAAKDGLNASHDGGVTEAMTDGSPKVVLNIDSRLEPRKIVLTYADGDKEKLFYSSATTEINTETYQYGPDGNKTEYSILHGANVYGGCYESGQINGDVEINVRRDIVSPDIPEEHMVSKNPEFLKDAGLIDSDGNALQNVPFAQYAFSTAMNVFGGGYGKDTEINGMTTINLTEDARVMKVFGGGEMGTVLGKEYTDDNGITTRKGSYINISATKPADATQYNTYMAYGGGYEGKVFGDVEVILNSGRLFDVYGGSCNADIEGSTYVQVGNGVSDVLEIKNSVYGANDFGGQLLKDKLWSIDNGAKAIRSRSHVVYNSGAIENELYGGAFGSYDYNKFVRDNIEGFKFPRQESPVNKQEGDDIAANTFVQIASQSTNANDYVKNGIYGGGRGFANATGIVDVHQTYVHLHSATYNSRYAASLFNPMTPAVYGGGYYSHVENTLVDAVTGHVGIIYGGTAGMSATQLNPEISYNAGTTKVNIYNGMDNTSMIVYGAGPLAGANTTNVHLYGGVADKVYGGSFAEGICSKTNIFVPETSTVSVNALYGGSRGKQPNLPCDVIQSNINFHSDKASVTDAIFGGNDFMRATMHSLINITVPVKNLKADTLINVYAAGDGAGSIAGYTRAELSGRAEVRDIYGGGRNGLVLDGFDGAMNNNDLLAEYILEDSELTKLQTYYSEIKNNLPTWNKLRETNTNVYLIGGQVKNIYGGGFNGDVTGDTFVSIGKKLATSHGDGRPTVLRSAYGGGQLACVKGNSNISLYDGYVGYKFIVPSTAEGEGTYEPNLKLSSRDELNLLDDNGNLYGGGYDEGGFVHHSFVNIYGGVVRNSVYGGGEIAAIGEGEMMSPGSYQLKKIIVPGSSNVFMHGGLVERNVFGGGRGFSYNESGGTIIGKKKYTDGFTFGKTNVEIYRGTVGTDASVALGHGNVFGGGNVGFVYSDATRNDADGYYYKNDKLTEDCRVVVSAYGLVKESAGEGGIEFVDNVIEGEDNVDDEILETKTFHVGEYIPTSYMNLLKTAEDRWDDIDQTGVVIRNAVFAGGNVSIGDDKLYANTYTVYGNCTASVIDVRNKDLVSLGGHEIGGLYGDGNLTLVDGYRELNITNYGTDYHNLQLEISYEDYLKLPSREREYYELKSEYICKQDFTLQYEENGKTVEKTYKVNENNEENIINETVYNFIVDKLTEKYVKDGNSKENAKELAIAELSNHFDTKSLCSLYNGRMMNTIQRADFCGMFGSRILLKGALDRVINVADNTKYTINRIGELSLNQDKFEQDGEKKIHGNYFGIYSVVNYLGALTSDVKFDDTRLTDKNDYDETKSYKEWKEENLDNKSRNTGKSKNTVALASGVFLELVKKLNDNNEKEYGHITGIIGLDLINVERGEGGGFVYAKNEHGKQISTSLEQVTLAASNKGARSNKSYDYDHSTTSRMHSSGNFVNDTKQIIDDCYPRNNSFSGENASVAHMWYIKGDHYVYDITISAYTGAPQAYNRTTNASINVTAGSEGRLKLMEVGRNRYAHFTDMQYKGNYLTANDSIAAGSNVYYANDPITYWDWSRLSEEEKRFFTDNPNTDTYICNNDFEFDGKSYTKGEVITHEAYEKLEGKIITNEEEQEIDIQTYFNISNAVSKDNGFLLTLDMSNPTIWDKYYQVVTGENDKKMSSSLTPDDKARLLLAPTFKCIKEGIYGQRRHEVNDLIDNTTKTKYDAINGTSSLKDQATFEMAYVAKSNVAVVVGGQTYHYVQGACMSKAHFDALADDMKPFVSPAYICLETVKMNDESGQHYIYGVAIPKEEYENLVRVNSELYKASFEQAYICIEAGSFGGKHFETNKNYPALDYCGVNYNERSNFKFNDDALDLLRHEFDREGDKISAYTSPWKDSQRVDYTAILNSSIEIPNGSITDVVDYIRPDGTSVNQEEITIKEGMEPLANYVYEALPNEQARYSQISINDDDNNTCYIVETTFFTGDRMYRAGTKLTTNEYEQMSDNLKPFIGKYDFTGTGTYYYCHESYKALTNLNKYNVGTTVPEKTIITDDEYDKLINHQKYFLIQGDMPRITSTLFVAPEIGISDLSQERIITAVYEYSYKEFNGKSYDNMIEKHIVNIHVDFESGAPSIGKLMPPATIQPGQNISINKPGVERGAYEVLGGNWEMYTNETDAIAHINGQRIENGSTPLFWYQNGYWVAYYAESYLGRTYSNAVQLSIANYHDINNMMNHVVDGKHEYLYVDEPTVMRNSKIYIDDRECTDNTMSELDLLYDFYKKTHYANELNEHVKNGANLDFHINSDVTTKKTEWQPIGDAGQCFEGSLHGNGHTIYGLDHSLFGNLCGKVYNLGVTGSFNGGGISDNGGTVTNSWINTTAKDINTETTSAVIGTGGTIINCYYPSDLTYKAGAAMPRSAADFLKGKVAYDLNRYYLEARKAIAGNASTGKKFSYIKANSDGSLETNPDGVTQKIHEVYYNDANYDTYVEDYFGNVDFTYSDGTLPLENDIRLSAFHESYFPIYPDDYIFFGQTLNYFENYHGETPSVIQKNDKRMLERTDYSSNRVYRAPAYRMSSTLNAESPAVYFNRYAVFASQYRSTPVDETLTAIDFTGNSGKETGIAVDYSPLLDYEGLAGFATRGITQNLLVYADARDNQSHTVLQTGLPEPALEYGKNNCVQPLPATTIATVNGHLVDFDGSNYTSPRTHFLVDKQNFNAPIAYSYVNDNAMWYQRKPETFIDIIDGTTHGWDAVSLPFTAGMVTTHQKGDITHFYGTEDKAHEYWLRSAVKMSDDAKSLVFNRPTDNAVFDKGSYETENSFLYSYYYQYNDVNDDSNTNSSLQDNTVAGDNYGGIQTGNHGNYYNSKRTYTDYLYLTGGVPYIIGFPGKRFYEFDMSGKFQPDYSSASIPALDAQTVTYISLLNENIPVSDEQTENKKTAGDGFAYTATYLAQSLSGIYTVNASGTAFEPATTTVPFRPYLAVSSSSAKKHKAINISYEATAIKDTDFDRAHGLRIYAKNRTIHVDSYLEVETDVNIYNTAGVLISSLRILPGEQRQVSVASGIYIVNRKKLSVN